MGGTASERSSGHCARLWTSVGHWRDGKNLERHTSDVGAHMAPLGVETAGRACYSINNTTFAMYSERDSLRRPWAHVGRSARSARIGSVVMGGATTMGGIRGGKGLRRRMGTEVAEILPVWGGCTLHVHERSFEG